MIHLSSPITPSAEWFISVVVMAKNVV